MKVNIKQLIIVLISFLFLFFRFQVTSYATTLFDDSFSNTSLDKWNYSGASNWILQDGKCGITLINNVSNLFPKDVYWNSEWKDYTFETDLIGKTGTDKNLIFRYIDDNNRLGIHHTGGIIYFEKVVNGQGYALPSYVCTSNVCNLGNEINYHFKIVFLNENIRVFLNDFLIFDYYDTFPYLPNGKIGFRVGTGAVTSTEVWYDNVVVYTIDDLTPTPTETPTETPTPTNTPTPTPTQTLTPTPMPTNSPTPTPTNTPTPTPTQIPVEQKQIVFLPGLGASFNYSEMILGQPNPDGWKMTPGANVYDNIRKVFEGKDFFHIFYYDWRKPVLENAQNLNSYIETLITTEDEKVLFVGHSLGGLVSRACIQTTPKNCHAEKLISVASPQLGSALSYWAIEGGEIIGTYPSKLAFELFLEYSKKPSETRRETVERAFPVVQNLLPNFNYLSKNGVELNLDSLIYKNSFLNLQQIADLSPLEGITNTISGTGTKTRDYIYLTDPGLTDKVLGNWPDGKPTSFRESLEGDDTVIRTSANFNNSSQIPNFNYPLDHEATISDELPLKKILSLLDQPIPSDPITQTDNSINYLVFFVRSPVKISSPNITPDSLAENELIIIPDPVDQKYTLNLLGLANNFYSLSVGQFYGNKIIWTNYSGDARTNVNQKLEFQISKISPLENPLIDSNGSVSKTMLSSRIKEFINEIKALNIKSKYKNNLIDLLKKIDKEKIHPQDDLDYLGILRNIIANYENKSIISQETAAMFRIKSSEIGSYLEFLAFLKPKTISKAKAEDLLRFTENYLKNKIHEEKLTKSAAVILSEAKDKFQKAKFAFSQNDYYKTSIYNKETVGMLLEVEILSK